MNHREWERVQRDKAWAVEKYKTDLRARIEAEAEVARLAPDGKHPKIVFMTHAAALRYAVDLIEGSE
jgi:hypothetical protein